MASAYHPFYDTLWNDDKLEGASFEGKAFFIWTFTNSRVRPSGIYRVTDGQVVADTGLPVSRVRSYLADLNARKLIVRDGAWLFVVGYFKRQPHHDNLLKGVQANVTECSSVAILKAFGEKYPRYSQWVADRLATVGQPLNETRLQSSVRAVSEQSNAEQGTDAVGSATVAAAAQAAASTAGPSGNGFRIPDSIARALDRAPRLCATGKAARLRESPEWWQAQVRAFPTLDMAACVLKAESYCVTYPQRAKRIKDLPAFMRNWFKRECE